MSARVGTVALRGRGLAAVVLPVLLMVVGCAAASQPDVQATAQRFQAAVRHHQTKTACSMLSDQARSSLESTSARPCPKALDALHLSTGNPATIEVWGTNAQARLPDGALFLAEFSSGWKVTGAGCKPQPNQPYSCSVRS